MKVLYISDMPICLLNINRCRHQCCHPYLRSHLQQLSFGFLKGCPRFDKSSITSRLPIMHLMHALDLLSSYRVLLCKVGTLQWHHSKKKKKKHKTEEEVRMAQWMAPWLPKFRTLFLSIRWTFTKRSSGLGAVPPRQARSRICRIRTRPGTWRKLALEENSRTLNWEPLRFGGFLNGGTQQPWVFLLKMIILACFGGTTI